MFISKLIATVALISANTIAFPFPAIEVIRDGLGLHARADTTVNPEAVTGTTCTDPSANIIFHDQNVAELSICGGIAGTIEKCGGNPQTTSGSSGTALFELSATTKGATISVSKGRWEGCVRAARVTCPTGGFSSVCIGGASEGNVAFTLSAQ